MTRFLLSFVLITALFSGCANLSKKEDKASTDSLLKTVEKTKKLSEKERQEQLVKAFQVLDKRMQKMVDVAKKSGPEAVEFLASDLFLKANDASIRGDSHTSAYLFKRLLELKPKDYFIRKKYAVELIRLGSLVEAKIVLEDLLKESSFKDETLGLILGGVHTALSDNESAKKVYKKVLAKHPQSEEACIFLSKSYGMDAKYQKAHKLLRKCGKAGKSPVFPYYQGKIYVKQGKKKSAQRAFQKALKIQPDYYQAAMALGLMKEEKEDVEGAIKIYKSFVKENPSNFPVLSRLVQLLFAHEKFDEVLPYAETLSSLDQTDLNLRVRLGILYTDAKKYDKAIGVFKEILAAVPTSDKVLYYLGSLYQQTREHEKALDAYGKISEDSSLYVDSSLQIAQILQALVQNNNKRWSDQYKDFLSSRGNKVEALKVEFQMMLATYFEGKQEYQKAITSIEEVRNINDYTEGHDYYLASLYEKINEYGKARNIVKEILEKNPRNAHALNFLGYSLLESGDDLEKAYQLIKKAVELKPEDGYIRDSLGWYYYKTGQLDKALEEVTKAFELVKTDVVITKHLAIIYKDMKKFQEAKKYFVEALKNCKYESEKRDVLEALGGLKDVRLPASDK